MIMELMWATFAHYLGDFALQNDYVAKNKCLNLYVLFAHAIVWTLPIVLVLSYFGIFQYWKLAFLVIGHMMIDAWKCKQDGGWHYLYIDQFVHLIQILMVVML